MRFSYRNALIAKCIARKNMNVIERTALHYRLERIDNPYWPYTEDTHPDRDIHEVYKLYEDIEWSARQWDAVNQLKGKVIHLEKTFLNTLKEIKTTKDTYTIK